MVFLWFFYSVRRWGPIASLGTAVGVAECVKGSAFK